jgi:hypothetical protein
MLGVGGKENRILDTENRMSRELLGHRSVFLRPANVKSEGNTEKTEVSVFQKQVRKL